MAATNVGAQNVPPTDDLDDSLFDYNVGDVFHDVDANMVVPTITSDKKENGADLGIDEEIKVTKKRTPIPRLDENRLLSPAGIPKLRRIAKVRLRFKGKGHEYSGVARILNIYQLWLDDLYPRAKFADALAIIEKLGHRKRMQTVRREWINERKAQQSFDNSEESAEKPVGEQTSSKSWAVKTKESPRPSVAVVKNNDDFYAATPKTGQRNEANNDKGNLFLENLIGTPPMSGQQADCPTREEIIENDEEDDQDALLALNDVW